MQTQSQVRFYITQSDDQPVVRSVPVPPRLAEAKSSGEPATPPVTVPARHEQSSVKNVAGRVRSAVKRAGNPR